MSSKTMPPNIREILKRNFSLCTQGYISRIELDQLVESYRGQGFDDEIETLEKEENKQWELTKDYDSQMLKSAATTSGIILGVWGALSLINAITKD